MATLLESSFSTGENTVAQADLRLLVSMVESLVVEFDQEKFEKLLSSDSISPKASRQYCKVSSETRSQVSSKTSPKVTRTLVYKASSATSSEVLKTSHGANMVCAKVSQETLTMTHGQNDGED